MLEVYINTASTTIPEMGVHPQANGGLLETKST